MKKILKLLLVILLVITGCSSKSVETNTVSNSAQASSNQAEAASESAYLEGSKAFAIEKWDSSIASFERVTDKSSRYQDAQAKIKEAKAKLADKAANAVTVGKEAYISGDKGPAVVCASTEVFRKVLSANSKNDIIGIEQLITAGLVYNERKRIKILVLGRENDLINFRVLEGDHYAEVWWTPEMWVKR